MQALEVEDLSFAWSDARALFSDVSFGLSPGFIGLVGANGAGKTTLARLIAGELRPASGRVRFQMDSPSIAVCAQDVDELPSEVVALSGERGARRRYVGLLGLDPAKLEHWNELSPGERKRWQLAAALSAEPDVLIVDEPTNHLDAEARAFVLAALARHRGIGVLISHDRELLDALTTRTLRVENGTARLYAGSYSLAREQWEAARTRALEVRQTRVAAQKRAREQLEREQRKLEAVRRNLSSKRRMKDPNDHDARAMGAKFRVERAEASISRAVSVKRGELTRTEARVEAFVVDKTLGRGVFVDYEPAPKPRVLCLVKDELCAGDRVLLRDVRLALGRHDKVRLTGPNGSGKTTLLGALRESSGGDDRICWLPQELTPDERTQLRQRIDTLSNQERGRLLSLLVALGIDPAHLLASPTPSPGEARKLAIAFGLAEHAYLLVLDEPTNHLDLPSIERLERALAEFPGAILLVSHDAAFAEKTTRAVWSIEDGAVNAL